MSKRTRAARRDRKKAYEAPPGMPDLAQTPRRDTDGKMHRYGKREQKRTEKDATQTVIRARMKMVKGLDERDARYPWHHCDQGRVIDHLSADTDEARDLWAAFVACCAVEERYAQSIGLSMHAMSVRLAVMPERERFGLDRMPVARSEEDRDKAAANKWMHQQGIFMRLPDKSDISAIYDGIMDRAVLWQDCAPTAAGRRFFNAMRELRKCES